MVNNALIKSYYTLDHKKTAEGSKNLEDLPTKMYLYTAGEFQSKIEESE